MPDPEHAPPACPTLTRRDLANYLKRSTSSIDRDYSAGRLPRARRLGQRLLWLKEEIDAWLRAGCPDRKSWEAMQ